MNALRTSVAIAVLLGVLAVALAIRDGALVADARVTELSQPHQTELGQSMIPAVARQQVIDHVNRLRFIVPRNDRIAAKR